MENDGGNGHGDPSLLRGNRSKRRKFPKQCKAVPTEGTMLMRKSNPATLEYC